MSDVGFYVPGHRGTIVAQRGIVAHRGHIVATKFAKYADLNKSYDSVQIALETFGSWGHHGWELVEWVGSKISQSTGELRAILVRKRTPIAIQRGIMQ